MDRHRCVPFMKQARSGVYRADQRSDSTPIHTPGLGHSGANCRAIHLQPGGERRDGRGAARAGIGQPGIQFNGRIGRGATVPLAGDAAGAQQRREPARQPDDGCGLFVLLNTGGYGCIDGVKRRGRLDQKPRELGHRGQGWCCAVLGGRPRFVCLPGASDVRPCLGWGRPPLDQPPMDLPGATWEALAAQLAPKGYPISATFGQPPPQVGQVRVEDAGAGAVRGPCREGFGTGVFAHRPERQTRRTRDPEQRLAGQMALPNLGVASLPAGAGLGAGGPLRRAAPERLAAAGRHRWSAIAGRHRQAAKPGLGGVQPALNRLAHVG